MDDGSDDATGEIVRATAPEARYIYQENKGVSAARNQGIKIAQGEFLAFLDSDDLWKKRKLEIQMEFMQSNPDIRVCYTNEIWHKNGKHLNQKKKHQKFSGWIFEKMLPLCLISASSVVIHRDVFETVGVFDETLTVCEDYDLWLRINLRYPVTFIDKPLIIKQGGHPDQLSQKYWGMDRYRVQSLQKLLRNPDLRAEQRPAVISMLHEKCSVLVQGFLKRGKAEEATYYQNLIEKYQS